MPLLVHPVVLPFDVGEFLRHVPACEVKQEGRHGAVAENYVLQSLAPQYDILPRYWTSLGKAEVDFIIQSDSDIIPVEVKAQTRLGGKSLSVYDATYHPVCKLRYSLNNLKQDGTLINIPLYLADWTKKIVSFIS